MPEWHTSAVWKQAKQHAQVTIIFPKTPNLFAHAAMQYKFPSPPPPWNVTIFFFNPTKIRKKRNYKYLQRQKTYIQMP